MRLDLYLNKQDNIQSRNKAQELIKKHKIKVNGRVVSKTSYLVEVDDFIEILDDEFYVSRSAYKLKSFIEHLSIDFKDKNALDIGSSTGGFTQVLLEENVKSVVCVDVGANQLHEKIKNEKKITFYENTDIRDFKTQTIFDIVTCDVSFISILHILNSIDILAKKDIIILFKPQFEVGANIKRDKKGVVKDAKAILQARKKFVDSTLYLKWELVHTAQSIIDGKNGNTEELFHFRKTKNKEST